MVINQQPGLAIKFCRGCNDAIEPLAYEWVGFGQGVSCASAPVWQSSLRFRFAGVGSSTRRIWRQRAIHRSPQRQAAPLVNCPATMLSLWVRAIRRLLGKL